MDSRSNEDESQDTLGFIDDPWTTGLQRDHPLIYARLERFLDYIAEQNGHERVRDEPKPQYRPPWHKVPWASARARAARVRDELDARNTADLKRMLNGEITEAELIAERGYKCTDSIRNTMYATDRRGGFGKDHNLYERWKELVMR